MKKVIPELHYILDIMRHEKMNDEGVKQIISSIYDMYPEVKNDHLIYDNLFM